MAEIIPAAMQNGTSAVIAAEQPKTEESTYAEILKSTALVGGSTVVNIVIGACRTKAMAVLLGPSGFGLAGLYLSVSNLMQSIAGIGVNSSGVRQIAEASASGDQERIARTAAVLRRTSLFLGAAGAAAMIALSRQISVLTFGTTAQATAIALLSLVVFFNLVSAGQGALIQGMRRISYLAQMGMLGAFYGMLITIPIVYFFRERGIVPSMAAAAVLSVLASWWYSRKIPVPKCSVSTLEMLQETRALLTLGVAFMANGLVTMGTAYVIRLIILRQLGVEAIGFYQAAWTIGGMYVGVILQGMAADFYPRLTAAANDNVRCNRLVNEQTRSGLLLAAPGITLTLTFCPVVIALLYSTRFGAAVGILRWFCLGTALQCITWPMGFIIVAKGDRRTFFWCELAWAAVNIGLGWVCIRYFGLNGAGMAFFGSYVFHLVLILYVVRRMSGFAWSCDSRITATLFVIVIGGLFCTVNTLPATAALWVGAAIVILTTLYSLRVLVTLIPPHRMPVRARRLAEAYARLAGVAGSRSAEA